MSALTAERLRALLSYDPATGVFTRLVTTNNNGALAGTVAGTPKGNGYLSITLDGVKHLAHRLAWLHVTGAWPQQHIDHINGRKDDNRIANLRDVDRSTNLQNRRAAPRHSKHLLGVTRNHNRFSAQISVKSEYRYLGTFDTEEQAHAAYVAAKRELHEGSTL